MADDQHPSLRKKLNVNGHTFSKILGPGQTAKHSATLADDFQCVFKLRCTFPSTVQHNENSISHKQTLSAAVQLLDSWAGAPACDSLDVNRAVSLARVQQKCKRKDDIIASYQRCCNTGDRFWWIFTILRTVGIIASSQNKLIIALFKLFYCLFQFNTAKLIRVSCHSIVLNY